MEARRLRARLETYYAEHGAAAAVTISIPVGSYIPVFSLNGQTARDTPPALSLPTETHDLTIGVTANGGPVHVPHAPLWRKYALAAGVMVLVAVIGGGILAIGMHRSSPMAETRGIREAFQITSFPGRQMQPSLSPDRKSIAFTWDGDNGNNFDIYVKPLRGREIHRLTSNPARDSSPAWSPDGKYIAFLRAFPGPHSAVYVIPADGGAERLVTTIMTAVAGIAWTPDSRYLVVPDGPPHIPLGLFRVSVRTEERQQLTDYKDDIQPSISPDGRFLAFIRLTATPAATIGVQPLTPDFRAAGPPQLLDIQDTGANPENREKVAMASRESVAQPSWAVDGQSILFTRTTNSGYYSFRFRMADRHVQAIDQLGSSASNLLEYEADRYIFTRSRDHRFLAWVAPDAAPQEPAAPRELWASQYDWDPDLSPDGAKVAFISSRAGRPALYVAKTDGSSLRKFDLPDVTPNSPRWSPDSSSIAFTGWHDFHPRVYVAVPGAPPKQLNTGDSDASNGLFSRDRKWIYFSSNRNGFSQIWRVPTRGGDPELMTQDTGVLAEESVDGRTLYYGSHANIRQLSLATRESRPFVEGACEYSFRVAELGIYALEQGPTGDCTRIRFHPFVAGRSDVLFSVGMNSRFCPKPHSADLLVGFRRMELNIESLGLN